MTHTGTLTHITALCLLTAIAAGPARAADPVYGITYIEVKTSADVATADALKSAAAGSRAEAGNIGYIPLARIGVPGQFAILEAWADQAAMETSGKAGPAATLRASLLPSLLAPIDRRPQTPLVVDLDRTGAALSSLSVNAMIVLTHVDIAPLTKDEGVAKVKALDAVAKQEPGNLAYDLVMQTNRPNHLSLVEVWRDAASLQAHQAEVANVVFRNTILPLSGAPYDQRVYRPID